MSEALDMTLRSIDERYSDKSAHTRRQMVGGAALALGGLAAATVPGVASANATDEDPQEILNVAATAEVLATIVNTQGYRRDLAAGGFNLGDETTRANVGAAALEELIHFRVLEDLGGQPLTKRIWVPDSVFANRTNFLETLEVGDQIFINAYMIGTTSFGAAGAGRLARVTAEFMGAEAVHRALARQSLGKLGNDRVFMKFAQREGAAGAPNRGQPGFINIRGAVRQLQGAGFGFGEQGATPGRFYRFGPNAQQTPRNAEIEARFGPGFRVNTFRPA